MLNLFCFSLQAPMAAERLFLGCTYWHCNSLQISLLHSLDLLFWRKRVEKAVLIFLSEPSSISVNSKTNGFIWIFFFFLHFAFTQSHSHSIQCRHLVKAFNISRYIKVKSDTRNLVHLLFWLPWDSGDKLNSSNKSSETVIYLNFGLILCTMGRWDSSHHHESELSVKFFL